MAKSAKGGSHDILENRENLTKLVDSMDSALLKASGTALHRQLFMTLRDRVLRGEYAPGAMIPSEEDLGRQFNVSRITVRRAVTDLEAQGLLEKRHGRGTFVTEKRRLLREPATLSFVDMQLSGVRDTKMKVLSSLLDLPPQDIRKALNLAPSEEALKTVRLYAAKKPLLLSDSWINQAFTKRITKKALEKQRMFELLISAGVDFGHVVQEYNAVSATAPIARLLDVEVLSPLVKLTRILYDRKRHPVQYQTLHFTSERSRLVVEIAVEEQTTLIAGGIIHDV